MIKCKWCHDRGCAVCPPPEKNAKEERWIDSIEPIAVIKNVDEIKKLKAALGASELTERANRLEVNSALFRYETLRILRGVSDE